MSRALRRARRIVAIVAVLAASGALAGAALARERIQGTAVTLELPPGFAPAKGFDGYSHAETGAAIVVTELPGPVAEVTAALTSGGMATQGMRLIDSTETTAAGRSALLIHLAQSVSGVEYEKWMLAFGEQNRTVLVVGTFSREAADAMREPIRAALLSVEWAPRGGAVRTAGLPFTISETSELKNAQRVGNSVVLARPGAKVKVDPADPLIVATAAFTDVAIVDVEDFARDRVRRSSEMREIGAIVGEELRVDGLVAYELRAEARDAKSGAPLRVYQLLVADGIRYFLVSGRVGTEQAERFQPQFQQIGRSLRRVR